ncbi:MAG: hypothetical protein ACXAEN_14845 [Candidatus Thorarchaeota archaeon]|jgi:hypothetical protein
MTVGDYIEIYELLRSYKGPDFARRMVEAHADHNPSYICVAKREDRVVGVAFSWQVSDPHDIEEINGFPGEQKGAKYIYWPLVYIHPEARLNGGIFPELVLRSLDSCPGASRVSFHRRERLHIISLKRLLRFYMEEQSDVQRDDNRRRDETSEPGRTADGAGSAEGDSALHDPGHGSGSARLPSESGLGQIREAKSF